MKVYIITGASRGLGQAFSELLHQDGHLVYSMSRNQGDASGHFKACDLSNPEQIPPVMDDIFKEIEGKPFDSITLINNAGMLSPIGSIADASSLQIVNHLTTNFTAPAILTSLFIQKTRNFQGDKSVINISSGAALTAFPGWSLYCSSKAGLEHFARCVAAEQELQRFPVKLINIGPGLIDTAMQDEIRSTDQADFPNVERFHQFKEDGSLIPPATVAQLIINGLERGDLKNGGRYVVDDFKEI